MPLLHSKYHIDIKKDYLIDRRAMSLWGSLLKIV